MGDVVEVVLPVFALIVLGYAAVARKLVSDAALQGMSLFVFGLAAPALIFVGGTRPHEGSGGAALAFLPVAVLMFGLVVVAARRIFGLTLAEAALLALACVFGNSVMMGVPIIIAAFGQPGVPPMLGILALQTVLLLGLATVVTEVGLHANAPWRRVLTSSVTGILKNPVVLSVIASFIWMTLALPVPGVLRRTLELLGGAAPPLALFCLGGGLVGISATGAWKETAIIISLKLVVLPLLTWGLALILGIAAIDTAVAVTMAALPTGANAFILARRYATGADRSGAAVVVSTALSILTLTMLIGYFRRVLA